MGNLLFGVPIENLAAVAIAAVILSYLAARKNRRKQEDQDAEEANDGQDAEEAQNDWDAQNARQA